MQGKRILLADDHPIIRDGISSFLRVIWPGIEIMKAANGVEAFDRFENFMPHISLIDYSMPLMNGFEASGKILKRHKEAKIILLTMFDSIFIALNFLKMGGRGFLSKDCVSDEIVRAIQVVSIGDYYFHSKHEKDIVSKLGEGIGKNIPKIKFTSLEVEIIVKTSRGLTIKEIAIALDLSPRTVEAYRYALLKKTNVSNSMELIDFFYRNGIGFNLDTDNPKESISF